MTIIKKKHNPKCYYVLYYFNTLTGNFFQTILNILPAEVTMIFGLLFHANRSTAEIREFLSKYY